MGTLRRACRAALGLAPARPQETAEALDRVAAGNDELEEAERLRAHVVRATSCVQWSTMLRPLDTSAEADALQIEVLRAMDGERRLAMAFELNRMALRLCEDGIRSRHPEYGEREVFLARARLVLGDTLFRGAYPDAPLLAP